MKKNHGVWLSLLLLTLCLSMKTGVSAIAAINVGVKSGHWIKYDTTMTNATIGMMVPSWMKAEFSEVQGTNITVYMTIHMQNGTEMNQTSNFDLSRGDVFTSGLVIPAGSKIGDLVNVGPYTTVTVASESTGNYAGAARTTLSAEFSQYGNNNTFHWDKQTGVMVELLTTSGNAAAYALATETNIWSADLLIFDWRIWATVAAVVIIGVTAALVLRRRKSAVTTSSEQNSDQAETNAANPQSA